MAKPRKSRAKPVGKMTDAEVFQVLAAVDPFVWVDALGVDLGGYPWKLAGHEYQADMLSCEDRRQVAKKGAQLGITQVYVLRAIHAMKYNRYPQGAMYLFPTFGDVSDFSKARFAPLIENNPQIAAVVQDTDATNIKKIGNAFLYLRGARSTKTIGDKKSSTQLKSAPCDLVVFDEVDEISDEMIALAVHRLDHSEIREEVYLGTPTVPDWGSDRLYQQSDQRVWMIRCEKCNHETCLELEFPDCLIEMADGSVIRACMKCKSEIFPRNGRWVAQYPDKAKGDDGLVGWWPSQLLSTYIPPKTILNEFRNPPNGSLAEVYNSRLGMAYVAAENRLSTSDVMACCGPDAMAVSDDGPCAMGVDVGKGLHVVIGNKKSQNQYRILKVCTVADFSDLHELAKRFRVKCAVLDKYPETRKCRVFQQEESYAVYLSGYQDGKMRGPTAWDDELNEIKTNRTEICDATHELVVMPGKLTLPRRCDEVMEFAKHCSNVVKVLSEDEMTGAKTYSYRKTGPDHYRHALNCFLLATENVGVARSDSFIGQFFNRRRHRTWMTA